MSEVISLTIWLFLGEKVIDVLDGIIGTEYDLNLTATGGLTTLRGCDNASVFEDAWEIMGLGYSCEDAIATQQTAQSLSNVDGGLIGVIGLVMVVMVLMNFVSYN